MNVEFFVLNDFDNMGINRTQYQVHYDSQALGKYPIRVMVRVRVMFRVRFQMLM